MAARELPAPRVVVGALCASTAAFLTIALVLGPLSNAQPPQGLVPGVVAGALLLPLLGLALGARLRPSDALRPTPDDARERAQARLRALIVQAALSEAGAMLCGVGLLLVGRDARVLAALVLPLLGLALAFARAAESD